MSHCFGIVGHGVVGSVLSRLLCHHGARVLSYDCLLDRPETALVMQKKIADDGSKACSLADVLGGSDYILSVVTPQSCLEVADCMSRLLHGHQVFVDLTSTSPAVKRMIGTIVTNGCAKFVEGVIIGAVSSFTSPVILLGGTDGESAASIFQQYGLAARFYSAEIGDASAFKMLRSIFSKGFEAVLIETLVAARRAGLMDQVWAEILATLSTGKVEGVLGNWICSHAHGAQRRRHEMQEVSRFLEEIGIEPMLSRASGQVFARSYELGVSKAFPEEPGSFRDVIEYLEQQEGTAPRPADAG
jgi:3-hydroxyisobutyrate dehydrogenase